MIRRVGQTGVCDRRGVEQEKEKGGRTGVGRNKRSAVPAVILEPPELRYIETLSKLVS